VPNHYPDRSGIFDLTFTNVVTGNTAYTTAHTFIFEGSDAVGVPKAFHIIGGIIDSGAVQWIRIYDVTNAQVICELTGITSDFPVILDLGALSNVPTGMAIWEVQQLTENLPGPDGDVQVASAYMEF